MNWIMLVVAFILGAISMFMMVCIGYAAKQEEPKNRVRFYVARDAKGDLWLYLGKPFRGHDEFYADMGKRVLALTYNIEYYGLKPKDYDNLKWEDEPVEVFLNLDE